MRPYAARSEEGNWSVMAEVGALLGERFAAAGVTLADSQGPRGARRWLRSTEGDAGGVLARRFVAESFLATEVAAAERVGDEDLVALAIAVCAATIQLRTALLAHSAALVALAAAVTDEDLPAVHLERSLPVEEPPPEPALRSLTAAPNAPASSLVH